MSGPAFGPLYVLKCGAKKYNGGWVPNGSYDDCLRFKHPSASPPVWLFFCGDFQGGQWVIANKARYPPDKKIKIDYCSKQNNVPPASPPVGGWKKKQGKNPGPKVVFTSFGEKDEVELFSTKQGKWLPAKVLKVLDRPGGINDYKCGLESTKFRKGPTIKREQVRALNKAGKAYSAKQFVEIQKKDGSWVLAIIVAANEDGTFTFCTPDGKAGKMPVDRIRPTPLCKTDKAAPAPTKPGATPSGGGGGGGDPAALAAKDAEIASLKKQIEQLKSGGSAPTSAPTSGGGGGTPVIDEAKWQELQKKQATLAAITEQQQTLLKEITELQSQLFESLKAPVE